MMKKDLDFFKKINDLQKTRRYGDDPILGESTAEHTFKLLQLVDYLYIKLELNLNYVKCIHIALYHDFGEMDMAQDYDITKRSQKDKESKQAYEKAKIEALSDSYYSPIKNYFLEYETKQTEEAKFIYACDKLEGMIHPLSTNEPIINHEIFATYADKAVKGFPKLMPLYKEIKSQLKESYTKWGFAWLDEYDEVFKEDF